METSTFTTIATWILRR